MFRPACDSLPPCWFPRLVAACRALTLLGLAAAVAHGDEMKVVPRQITLRTPEASEQLLVTRLTERGRSDVTRRVVIESADPAVAVVSPQGRVQPVAAGVTEIVITASDQSLRVPVDVRSIDSPPPVSFRRHVIPVLSKAGCNSGGCHGKAEGQNGFQLSVFGFDPAADHAALIKEGRGRRVRVADPRHSLLLMKASGDMPHGGGVKLPADQLWYQLIARWIREGGRDLPATEPPVSHIEVQPASVILTPGATQQLKVTAIDAAGQPRCVTAEAEFQSNAEDIAGVDSSGLVSVTGVPGEAAVLVRYMGHVSVANVTLPNTAVAFERPPEHNFIDRLVWDKLEQLGIQPSPICDDATFLRRVYLDICGVLPKIEASRRFLSDPASDKRSRLIEQLLQRDEYADYQALRWADILQVDKNRITPQGAVAMTRWLRRQFQQNTPYDQFAARIITARGNTLAESPAAFYHVQKQPEAMARAVSQLFLGVRIECAQCHHHPFEKWGQEDYFALAGFFSGVKVAASPTGGQKIVVAEGADLKHPRTGEPVATAALGATPAELQQYRDRRQALADWLIAADNPFFARMIANRLWAHYFGRGLVEPLDDMRATNPATNEPLLAALAEHLIEVEFDLRRFTRTLLESRVYQLSAEATDSNREDAQNHSHASWKAVPAEVLLDAICQATGVAEEFNGWPAGYRAVQIWDNRMPSYFFRIFGRPQRVSVCECERGNEPSMAQALHLMNSPESVRKIRHRDGRARQLAESQLGPDEIIEELYLATLSRLPSQPEKQLMLEAYREAGDRRVATEDVLWALLNTREFVYNH